jgi:hypothetical protein
MDLLTILASDRIDSMLREAAAGRLAEEAAQRNRTQPRVLRRTLQLVSTRLSNGRAGPLGPSPSAPRPAA